MILEFSQSFVLDLADALSHDPEVCADLLERLFVEGTTDSPDLHVGVGHAVAPAEAETLLARLRDARPRASYDLLVTLGPVIGTHAGPGLLGVSGIPPALLA